MTTTAMQGFSFLSKAYAENPYRFLAQLRSQDPVHYEPDLHGYFITRHQDIRTALLDNERFATDILQQRAEPVMRGPVLAQMNGSEHTAKRKIIIRGFTGARLEEQGERIKANTIDIIKSFIPTGRIDLVRDFGKKFAVFTTLDVLGIDKNDWEQVASWHSDVAEFITSLTMNSERQAACITSATELESFLRPIIEQRRRAPGPDLISALCSETIDGVRMSVRDVTALIINVLAAATEPADKTLALVFKHLIDHPNQLAKVRSEPSLTSAAIAETLRFTPPVQLIPRLVQKDVMLAGKAIPAGATVYCVIAGANRDPEVFIHPDDFDIERPDLGVARSFSGAAQHMAFGTGMHMCVGAAFARVQLETVIRLILPLMENLAFESGFDYSETGLYTRGPSSLQLTFDPAQI
ncbi:cytochrome P450 [Corynebacterium lizhenjunii]|uniref:cytochrome P450 n=1 Tax=Corynebacterium lizhenjunii TaxID=2709394 RepID=UPI0013E99F32|nr:cytochrome P450 [Corynebacterium lizhenjunii]